MTPFICIILCDRKNPSLNICTLCISTFTFKMTTDSIVFITTLDLQTFSKGHHVYKHSWTPKLCKQ